jgi:hypothetical protein
VVRFNLILEIKKNNQPLSKMHAEFFYKKDDLSRGKSNNLAVVIT